MRLAPTCSALAALLAACSTPPIDERWEDPGARELAFCAADGPHTAAAIVTPVAAEPTHLGNGFIIALVPAGYGGALDRWRADADALTDALVDDDGGVVGMAPDLFRIERIDLESDLGACVQVDNDELGLPRMAVDLDAVGSITAHADAVVIVVRGRGGTANAPFASQNMAVSGDVPPLALSFTPHTPAAVVLSADDDVAVLQHELGHALAGLADEYSDEDGCFEPDLAPFTNRTDVREPNLTLDPAGTKWRGLVDGAVVGGGRFTGCVFRPQRVCRMGDDDTAPFCPVCTAAIARVLDARRPGGDHEAPQCVLEADSDPGRVDGSIDVAVHVDDDNRGVSARLSLDGALLDVARGDDVRSLVFNQTIAADSIDAARGATLELVCSDRFGHDERALWHLARR